MDRYEFDSGIEIICDAFGRKRPGEATLDIWHEETKKIPSKEWKRVVRRIIRHEQRFPTGMVACIYSLADKDTYAAKEDHKTYERYEAEHRRADMNLSGEMKEFLKVFYPPEGAPAGTGETARWIYLGVQMARLVHQGEVKGELAVTLKRWREGSDSFKDAMEDEMRRLHDKEHSRVPF